MLKEGWTMITVKKATAHRVKELYSAYPRESYQSILDRLIKGELHPSDPNEDDEGTTSNLSEIEQEASE